MYKVVLCAAFLAASVCGNPINVPKCRLEDSKCMTASFQQALPAFLSGIPELGIEVLDPLAVGSMSIDLAGLKFDLTQGKVKGVKKTAVFESVKFDSEKKRLEVIYHTDATIKGNYKASGRLLVLPIEGDGQVKLKLKNMWVKLLIPFEMKKGDDGNDYIHLKSYTVDYDVKEKATIDLTNLFNGNKELGDAALQFMNNNWKDITKEFGGPIMDAVSKVFFNNVKKYLEKSPVQDIAIV